MHEIKFYNKKNVKLLTKAINICYSLFKIQRMDLKIKRDVDF